MKTYQKNILIVFSILTIFIPNAPAWANPQDENLETITVTAQKREENVHDVPISMEVLTGMDLEENKITDMKQLVPYVPNLFTTPSLDNNSLVIRGVSTHNTVLHPAAGIFVDDIAYPLNRMQNPEFLDIERVEVLRGPQGTLYGKNTESGAVNIITRQPDNQFQGKVFGEAGFFAAPHKNAPLYKLGGHISGPIVKDRLFAKFSFQGEDSDGYFKNIYKNNDKAAKIDRKIGRLTLRYTPLPQWDIAFISDISKNNDHYGQWHYIDGPMQSPAHTINWNRGNYWTADNNNQVFRIKYKAANFDLLSITSRSDYRREIVNDAEMGPIDASFGPIRLVNQDFIYDTLSYSQELRFASPKQSSPLTWVAGVFGSKDKMYVKSHTAPIMVRDTDMEYESLAIFGQATYTVLEHLHLTAGARYEHQNVWGEQTNASMTMVPGPPRKYSRSDSNDEFLPKASLAYDVTNDVMVYASYGKGFLSGGHDFHMAETKEDLYFSPEHTNSYEAGIKTVLWDSRLTVNADVFYIDISDKQVVEYPVGQSPMARDVTNAAEASSKGFEVELRAKPVAGLDIFAGIGYTKSQFDDWIAVFPPSQTNPNPSSFDYQGNDLVNAPRYTFHLGAQYRTLSGFFFRADLLGTGDYYYDPENTQKVDGYETVNVRMGYEQERFDIMLWADNAFDKHYLTSKFRYMGTLVNDGAPRCVGIKFTWRF